MNERIEIPISVELQESSLNAHFDGSAEVAASFGEQTRVSTADYDELYNKPKINNIVVEGEKTSDDYRLQDKMQALTAQEIEKILYLD